MYDPTGGSMGSSGNKVPMPPIIYNAELANGQVAAAEKALKALEAARRYMEEMPVYKRIYFCSYLRRAPYWLATARVQAALLAGREALEAGAPDGGLSRMAAARDTAKRDYDAADVNAKELDSQGFCDSVRFFPYGMLRADAMEALDRAERMAQAGASASGAEGSAGRRGRCVAEAGVRDGRAVDFPVKPTDKSEVWSGERIIDRPTVISRKTLYVMPGTKVVFRGEGRLEVQFGSIYAANADFSADGVMTRNFRIHATRPPKPCWFDNCRFTGMKCEKLGKWGTGFLRLTGSSIERAQLVARHCTFSGCSSVSFQSAGKSEIANCLFENGETGVCALLSLGTFVEGCVFRNMSAVAITLRQADSTDVVGNVFERCLGGTLFSLSKGCRLIGNSYSDCKPYRVRSNANDNFVAEPLVVNE